MSTEVYRVGSRKSALATAGSNLVLQWLRREGIRCDLITLETAGDADGTTPLYQFESEGPGLFTKQIERALLENRIDVAVHSLKDLPTDQPEGLQLAAISKREATNDCLIISPKAYALGETLSLKRGSTVGTSSLRREAQLFSERSDLKVIPIRGNVPTRVRAVAQERVDAVVLAEAGLLRLSLDLGNLRKVDLPLARFVSAPGQGALAIETRKNISSELRRALQNIHDEVSATETRIERRILKGLLGGCTLPLGVRVFADSGVKFLKLQSFLGIAEARGSSNRRWVKFHRFDICDAQEETLVAKTVAHFKGLTDGNY